MKAIRLIPQTEVRTLNPFPLRQVLKTAGAPRPFTDQSRRAYESVLVTSAEPKNMLERKLLSFFARHAVLFNFLEVALALGMLLSFGFMYFSLVFYETNPPIWSMPLSAMICLISLALGFYCRRLENLEIRSWVNCEVYLWTEGLPLLAKIAMEKIAPHVQKSGLKGVTCSIRSIVSQQLKDPLFVMTRKNPTTGEILEEYALEAWDTPDVFAKLLEREPPP